MLAILFFSFLLENTFYLCNISFCSDHSPVRVSPSKVFLHVCSTKHETQQIHMSQMRFMGAEAAEHYGLSCKYICRELLK